MYDYLSGILVLKEPTRLVVEAGGVGYEIDAPISTTTALEPGSKVKVFVHLLHREDSMRLAGFATVAERAFFRKLISISGIGPNAALTILSSSTVEECINAIITEDAAFFKKIKGIGDKTAKRVILELKPAAEELLALAPGAAAARGETVCRDEACRALVSLGFTRSVAESAVKKALKDFDTETGVEELVKQSLRYV